MRTIFRWLGCLFLLIVNVAVAGDGNRLTYLDESCDPYYVGRDFPKLTTPQWIGEEGVEAVVVLAIDDMRDTGKYEAYLRPILERLKEIDGRAPVSIMSCNVDPQDPQLQTWLKEGLSIEVHTVDHPCPLLQGGDFAKAKSTYDRCVDLMSEIPGNKPVAFRMPCCDSLNTPSPRFWMEIFNKRTDKGNFLSIDSSVFQVFTSADDELPRELVLDSGGGERFKKYIPFPSFVNTIENYPYPYVIGGLCWEFPCMVPSDWEAQHLQKPNNPKTVEDMKAALDATVIKQGVFNLVFHPHGWIRNDQVVELIDHAVAKHGKKVKFLTFAEALERLNENLLAGEPLRVPSIRDNGSRLLDVNNDGFMDVVIGNERRQLTRIWSPKRKDWVESEFPAKLTAEYTDDNPFRKDWQDGFGVLRADGAATYWHFENGRFRTWDWDESGWAEKSTADFPDPSPFNQVNWLRLRDVDHDGTCELLMKRFEQDGQAFQFVIDNTARKLERLPFRFPPGTTLDGLEGRGLRLVDVNHDGFDDVLFSDGQRYSLHLWKNMQEGWSIKAIDGERGKDGGIGPAIPMIVRPDGTNNGAWFHSGHLWVQNEDTNRLPDLVDRLSFDDMLKDHLRLQDERGHFPPPKTPDEALAAFDPRPGMKVELVAAEPLIVDPVAFDWGPDGRLWVVEMRDYPNGFDGEGKPGGRVKVLTDKDGDGRYDESALFLDDIPFPTGIKVWRKGVLVTAAPEILYAEDTDGDGKADKQETLYRGFGEGNQQHRVNGLRWGLDNWLHVGNGDSGGTIKSLKTGESVNVNGRDLRIRPDEGLLETTSGQTQFGRDRDDWGNWFGGNNSNPMWHYVLDDRYLRRNPHFAPPDVRKHVSVEPGAARVFPTSRTLSRFNDFDRVNRFTSACSPMIYRDDLLLRGVGFQPANSKDSENHGRLEAYPTFSFVCEPVHNLVHREIMTRDGVTFTSRRADDEQTSEFLASRDNWFRPTMVRTGPDGALWIADMYRIVIEHPKWIPKDWQSRLDVRAGDDRGRIYRVYPADTKPREIPQLDKSDTAELVAALESPNGWVRDMAHQMLLWRNDRHADTLLMSVVVSGTRAATRLQALSTLDGLRMNGDDEPPDLAAMMFAVRDSHPAVRRLAVRLYIESLQRDELPAAKDLLLTSLLDAMRDESELFVVQQLAYSLGELRLPELVPQAGKALAQFALKYHGDPYIAAAVFSSVNRENATVVLGEVLQSRRNSDPPAKLVEQLLGVSAAFGDDSTIGDVAARISDAKNGKLEDWQFHAMAGLLDALDRRKTRLRDLLDTDKGLPHVERLFQQAVEVASDGEAAEENRLGAIRLVGRGPTRRPEDIDVLGGLLRPRNSQRLQAAAIDSLARQVDTRVAALLLDPWPSYSPALRSQALDTLLSKATWTSKLIGAIENKDIAPSSIDARRRNQLLAHNSDAIRSRAEKVFAGATDVNREKVVAEFQSALTLAADATRGKAVFAKRCAACHRLEEVGFAVGPDLAALTDRSPQAMLVAMFDPNRAVEDKFRDYAVVTDDGRVFNGMIVAETGNSVTLNAGENKQHVILRNEIDELRATGKSLMPEGLEKDLAPQDVADLVAYLRDFGPPPKEFPGNKPETVWAGDDGVLHLLATNCKIYGPRIVFEQKYQNLGWWAREEDRAVWSLEIPAAGQFQVILDYASQADAAGDKFVLTIADQSLRGAVESTGTWDVYREKAIGVVTLPAGAADLLFRSDGPVKSALIDLRGIRLQPLDD